MTAATLVDWRELAACKATPELHTADLHPGWHAPTRPQAQARHICLQHCPVVDQCSREAQRIRPYEIVWGALVWSHYRPASVQPPDPGCGVWCLAVSEETHG